MTAVNALHSADKLKGLDTLRAVAALWVFASHLGEYFHTPEGGGVLKALLGIAFNGPAAVILFFFVIYGRAAVTHPGEETVAPGSGLLESRHVMAKTRVSGCIA